MKNFTTALKKALFLCFCLFAFSISAQTTHIVNNNANTSADFTNLQAAIDAAANGDIIHVQQSSTSYGNIILDKELTIIGRSHTDASYVSEIGIIDFRNGSSNCTLKGLKIQNVTEPFDSSVTYGTIENLVIQDNRIGSFDNIGIYRTFNNVLIQGNVFDFSLSIGSFTSNFLVTNNIFNGSLSLSMVDTLLLSNNIFGDRFGTSINNFTPDLLNISNCIFVNDYFQNRTITLSSSTGTFQITNCITYNYDTGSNLNFDTASNITFNNNQENIDPLFTNRVGGQGSIGLSGFIPGFDDLTLQSGSPVTDEGLYDGYAFKPIGTPTGLPSLKIDSYDPTVPKNSDLTVTITAKTN